MFITQNCGLIWKGFPEEIIAGISKLEAVKNILECPSKLLQDPGAVGVWVNFPEILLFVTLLLINFMVFSCQIILI